MEGDAGASRLNPSDTDDSSSSEVKSEDSEESEIGTDQIDTADVGVGQTSTGTAAEGLDQTTETNSENSPESEEAAEPAAVEAEAEDAAEPSNGEQNTSRLGRGWFVGITAVLLVLAGGVGAGGYLALRSHQDSQAIARRDAAAVNAAKDCVAATQAPDVGAMRASAQKIIDCGTGAFRTQAILYSGLLVDAYQAANAHVQVSDMRAAVERNNADGSVDVLVALRVKVTNSDAQNRESGYRLRVTMAPDEGQYRIAKLDQVAK